MATRSQWVLSAGTFDKLLDRLCVDREAAARRYETIRAGLLRFFGRRVGGCADELVDVTMDRVCHCLERGETFTRAGPFFYGVARNVLREHVRAARRHAVLDSWAAREYLEARLDGVGAREEMTSAKLAQLRRCLGRMGAADRTLIEEYYGMGTAEESTVRQARAAQARGLGISPGNLRVRAYRLRQRLEECCVNGEGHAGRTAVTSAEHRS